MKSIIIKFLPMTLLILFLSGCKYSDYNLGVDAIENESFEEAILIFSSLGDYKNSKDLLSEAIDKQVSTLLANDKYDEALSVLYDNSSVDDYSVQVTKIEEQREMYNTYNDAIVKFQKKEFSEGFNILDTLPKDYRNVSIIYNTYAELLECPFKGVHKHIKDNIVRQKIVFSIQFDRYDECFELSVKKEVYWSDGDIFKEYYYSFNLDEIDSNVIKIDQFVWEIDSQGRLTETEKGSITNYY